MANLPIRRASPGKPPQRKLAKTTIEIAGGLKAKKPKPGSKHHFSLWRGDIVSVQKNPRSHPKSKAEAAWICAFSGIARYTKRPTPQDFNEASAAVSDTGWYYRDMIHTAMAGKLLLGCEGLKITTPTVKVKELAAETLTSGVAKALTPDTKVWDNNYFWEPILHPTRLYFRSCGVYAVGARVDYTAVSGSYRTTFLRKNGTETIAVTRVPVPTSQTAHTNVFGLFYFDELDYIECMAQTNQAGVNGTLMEFWAMAITPEQVESE